MVDVPICFTVVTFLLTLYTAHTTTSILNKYNKTILLKMYVCHPCPWEEGTLGWVG